MTDAQLNCASMVGLVAALYLPAAAYSFSLRQGPDRKTKRLSSTDAFSGALQRVSLLMILGIAWWRGWWSEAELSRVDVPVVASAATGILAFIVFTTFWRTLQRQFPGKVESPASYAASVRLFWPRRRWGRVMVGAQLTLNPFTEELCTRGVLVGMVTATTGSLALGLTLGALTCVMLHLYQGARHLPYHLTFFALTVGLMFWAGLVGAIAAHVFADLAHARPGQHLVAIKQLRAWAKSQKAKP